MLRIAIVMSIGVLALLVGCNKDEPSRSEASASNTVERVKPAETATSTGPEYASVAGSMIADSSGTEVQVISVGEFDLNVSSLGGLVAIEGRVAEVYPERGAFVLVDYDRMKDCSSGCCPQATVPVRLALEDFTGKLPELETEVVVVGELALNDTGGYELAIREIRRGEEVLLCRSQMTVS